MIRKKSMFKIAGAACAATGIVALSGLIASGAAVGAVVEMFKSAAETMKKALADDPQEENSYEEADDPQEENSYAEADEPTAEDTNIESDIGNQESSEN